MPVLFIVFILTALAVTVTGMARRETRAANVYLRQIQQYYAARGAVNYVAAELQQVTNNGATPPQLTPPPDTDSNGWTQIGDAWFKVDVIDTSSRVNINTATVDSLAKLPAFLNDPNTPAAIVDWRDTDDTPTTYQTGSGAESDYYQTLNPPYAAKNAPFDTINELMLVRGITSQTLFGQSTLSSPSNPITGDDSSFGMDYFGSRAAKSRQGTGTGTGTSSTQPAIDTSASQVPLAELLTTYSRELNVASDGTTRVNVLTASQQDLQEKAGMSANLAQRLIQQRQQQGSTLRSIADLLNIPGFTRQIMQQIGDKISVTSDQYRTNVVNINAAPAEVLATIPGVDQTIYNAVIQARQSGTTFTGLNDIFQLTSLNRTQLQALLDHVCTKSSVYLLRVRVRIAGSQRVYVAEALIELPPQQTTATTTEGSTSTSSSQSQTPVPKILQWREVPRTPGWSSWVTAPNYYSTGGAVVSP